ncbi:alpha/beta hydrolase [Clostridium tetani]|uniref:alpha/beta hydrolase n=1 Tax=Clostridium tetani TaxID=1513 RepID=UPI000513C543|nr:alpha/beta hydrolase [Clostridium tetani]KGI44861.1 hypothetical protein KY55_02560 [Clostridium tetani]RXI70707.1 alpha/beta hydrolase [Clostridium tetani]BDR76114.1 hypothetical protein K154306013_17740 [Clostridium tetani]BDR87232.1 hypothetical protein N071400001_18400 [Clostridium tetani]
MHKKIVSIVTLVLITASILTGCNNHTSFKKDGNITKEIVYEINSTKNITNKVKTQEFNLGTRKINDNGNEYSYKLEGIISAPEELKERAPVVLIFHGQHGDGDNEFEKGFKYLTEALAQNNMISISVDTSINYAFEYNGVKVGEPIANERIKPLAQEILDSLQEANLGNEKGYNIDLKDKIDLDNIGLIGHSVAGQGVFKIAEEQINKGNKGIKGIISLTPANNEVIEKFPDVPAAIIVSEYDGDVIHGGADIYNDIINHGDRKSPLGLTYLIGANHNAYNTLLGEKEFSKPEMTYGTYPDKISKEDHRKFFANYAVDNMKYFFGFENSQSPIFDRDSLPSKMYGYETLNMVNYKDEKALFDKNLFNKVNSKGVETKKVIDSFIQEKDSAKVFNHFGDIKELNLMEINWKKGHSSIQIPLYDTNLKDLSKLKFRWALNSPSDLNSKDKVVSFKLSLVDSKDKEYSINISNDKVSAMKYIYGEPLTIELFDDMSFVLWSRATPVTDTIIPLGMFNNIDLSNIKHISIEFDNTETGSIMLNEINGIK